jgi:hypothetical protein
VLRTEGRNLALAVALLLICGGGRADDYHPVGEFHYTIGGISVNPTSGLSNSEVDTVLAKNAIAGFQRRNALYAQRFINGTLGYCHLIRDALTTVESAQQEMNPKKAREAVAKAKDLRDERDQRLPNKPALDANCENASFFAANSGSQDLANLAESACKYRDDVKASVDQAQSVPARLAAALRHEIATQSTSLLPQLQAAKTALHAVLESAKQIVDSTITSWSGVQKTADEAIPPGVALLNAARRHEGEEYGSQGLDCSGLIKAAANAAHIPVANAPSTAAHTSTYWFANGLGPGFEQIAGGDGGITVASLINQEVSNHSISIGSVIVADADSPGQPGHAALFDGIITVGGRPQLIVFDANAAGTGWCVSVTSGTATELGDGACDGLEFPGHAIGEHVTRLQWGTGHRVKVFRPRAK